MNIKNLLKKRSEIMIIEVPSEPIVISSRIRLARNFNDQPFPGWANSNQLKDILASCCDTLSHVTKFKRGAIVSVNDLTQLEKQVLTERYMISSELCEAESSGVAISNDQTCSAMINEEDHLRLQIMRKGFHFDKIWKAIDKIDTDIESSIDYAFSSQLGYLTACPTNVGTGMRASVMMHLPGLVMIGQMEKVIRAVNKLGIAVRGSFGEGSEAIGSVFQISNQQTLGESESTILGKLSSVLKSIIKQEGNAREVLLQKNKNQVLDKIGRSFGILIYSQILTSSEALNMLSLMRLATDLGFLKEGARSDIDSLFIECQPGHIQFMGGDAIPADERDEFRAQFMREQFKLVGLLTL